MFPMCNIYLITAHWQNFSKTNAMRRKTHFPGLSRLSMKRRPGKLPHRQRTLYLNYCTCKTAECQVDSCKIPRKPLSCVDKYPPLVIEYLCVFLLTVLYGILQLKNESGKLKVME